MSTATGERITVHPNGYVSHFRVCGKCKGTELVEVYACRKRHWHADPSECLTAEVKCDECTDGYVESKDCGCAECGAVVEQREAA